MSVRRYLCMNDLTASRWVSPYRRCPFASRICSGAPLVPSLCKHTELAPRGTEEVEQGSAHTPTTRKLSTSLGHRESSCEPSRCQQEDFLCLCSMADRSSLLCGFLPRGGFLPSVSLPAYLTSSHRPSPLLPSPARAHPSSCHNSNPHPYSLSPPEEPSTFPKMLGALGRSRGCDGGGKTPLSTCTSDAGHRCHICPSLRQSLPAHVGVSADHCREARHRSVPSPRRSNPSGHPNLQVELYRKSPKGWLQVMRAAWASSVGHCTAGRHSKSFTGAQQ